MRLVVCLALLASGVACAGPDSTGALWSQQYLEREKAYFAVSDVQHRALAQMFELGLADDGLAAEAQRIDAALRDCPGSRHALAVSPDDARRDSIRVRAEGDSPRLAQVARLALADWYVRRASATSDQSFCQRAQAARAGALPSPPAADLLEQLPTATVTRDPRQTPPTPNSDPTTALLARYVLGSIDAITAATPLPHYLATVYGGYLVTAAAPIDAESAAVRVDAQAVAYPDWEPDALYAALSGGQR
jgi:hypothetical protein